jgi:hypothetical protein
MNYQNMKTLFAIIAAAFVSVSSFGQGTVIFYNRGLTGPNGTTYNAPVFCGVTDPATAVAQMFLVTGTAGRETLTALEPVNTFREFPNNQYLVGPVVVPVPGQAPGTTGLRFVVRVWQGAVSYDMATVRDQSYVFTVGPLGGARADGQIFLPPDLGGPDGVGGLQFFPCPEPSTIALGVFGAAILLCGRRYYVATRK